MTVQPDTYIEYKECYIALIDILGFSEMVKKSIKNNKFLDVSIRALNVMVELPSGQKISRDWDSDGNLHERTWRIQTRVFSDCIVIFMPKGTKGITQILFMVRYIHDRMLELELCVRGAITIGKMYWNDAWSYPRTQNQSRETDENTLYQRCDMNFPVTLGLGFIDAYKLESECAIYPRVLISRRLYRYLKDENLSSLPLGSGETCNSPLIDFVRKDADGMYFLDLLHPKLTRNDTECIVRGQTGDQFSISWQRGNNTHEKVMANVRDLVERKRKSSNEKIRAKYEWLESYYRVWNNQETSE